jgi:hypothetical protein
MHACGMLDATSRLVGFGKELREFPQTCFHELRSLNGLHSPDIPPFRGG